MVIYVAGKLTDKKGNVIDECVDIAAFYAAQIMAMGHVPIVPHLNFDHHYMLDKFKYEVFMEADLQLILRADAVFLLPNWASSKGAKREIKFANEHNIPILTSITEVIFSEQAKNNIS